MKLGILAVLGGLAVAGCAQTQAIRTSNNTMVIQTSAAPACGAQGAARVAQQMAAVETLRAGYDGYVIMGGDAQNNVGVYQAPGTSYTTGQVNSSGYYSANTTYSPGPTMVYGSHDQSFAIRMFKRGEPGVEQSIDARSVLGPDWQKIAQEGVQTC